jgi:hypothetical protein
MVKDKHLIEHLLRGKNIQQFQYRQKLKKEVKMMALS